MERFGLEKRYIDFIKSTLKNYIMDEDAKFYIFGSRSKGTNKEYSDVDVAIKLPNSKINENIMSKILIEFENSTFPYEVDVVDLNAVNENFRAIISDDLKEL